MGISIFSKNLTLPEIDWQPYGEGRITVDSIATSPNLAILNVIGGSVSQVFALGDKVRLKQGGAYKYYYVTAIDPDENQISLTGDDAAPVTVATITDFSFSRATNPVGFPSSLTVQVAVSVSAGSTISISTLDVELIMNGALVRFVKQLNATITALEPAVLYVKFPVERAQAFVNPIGDFKAWYCNDSGTQTIGYPTFEEPFGGAANTIGVYKWDMLPWTISGGQTLFVNIDYEYIIS